MPVPVNVTVTFAPASMASLALPPLVRVPPLMNQLPRNVTALLSCSMRITPRGGDAGGPPKGSGTPLLMTLPAPLPGTSNESTQIQEPPDRSLCVPVASIVSECVPAGKAIERVGR